MLELVIVTFLSLNCTLDFNEDYWKLFDSAMMQEWNVTATSFCLEVERYPTNRSELYELAESWHLPNGTQTVFITPYDLDIHRSQITRGVALPQDNIAFVQSKPNGRTLSEITSHEILHLILEERGFEDDCYSKKVHRYAYREPFAYYETHWILNRLEVIARFEC